MNKEDLDIIVKMRFGSHLYGTNTEESDIDIKGIFMPSREQVLMGRIPKSVTFNTKSATSDEKNTHDDVDEEYYSLHYFVNLACQGQTVALDMLHAHADVIYQKDPLWDDLVASRHLFYSKNTKSFVGYARKQAAKYGVKGSRLSDAKQVVEFLGGQPVWQTLSRVWDQLPEGEHIHKQCRHDVEGDGFRLRLYEVCGKKVQETVTVEYAHNVFKAFVDKYGERARLAEKNEGIDWKAMSHAVRAAYQVYEMLDQGTITMPRPEAEMLKFIKAGCHPYSHVSSLLEAMMDKVEASTERSSLPDHVDRVLWDEWLLKWMKDEYQTVW